MNNTDVIVDLQYGSTGKGLIAGYLGVVGNYDMVINANMPNAGHTYIDMAGRTMVHKVLPSGVCGANVKNVMIGPGSVFSVDQLVQELWKLDGFGYYRWDLWIHENATVLLPAHFDAEQGDDRLASIGSTKQGSAAAMIQKIMRNPIRNPTAGALLRSHPQFGGCLLSQKDWLAKIVTADEILLEGAQGYSLGINAGFYPYCTSRDCTPARFMADCGVPLPYLRRVIGTARMHPIRVAGDSGGCYSDQKEIQWSDLGVQAEFTTVTKKMRRVFTWSERQMEEAIHACQPDHIFLNFCNYDPDGVDKVVSSIAAAASSACRMPVVQYFGWGATHNHVHERKLDPCDMTAVEFKRDVR